MVPKSLYVRDLGAQDSVIKIIELESVRTISEQVEICVYSFLT